MAQVRPQRIEIPPRGLDLTGQQFGLLRALYPVASGQRGVSWLCECDCGRFAIRVAAQLRQPGEHQCSECVRELFQGSREASRSFWRERYMLMWAETGRFYSDTIDRVHAEQIKETCLEHGIPFGEEPLDTFDRFEQDDDRYCTFISERTQTLKEVGEDLGVTRERIRCIQNRALRKLKLHWLIKELWYGEPQAMPLSNPESPPSFAGGCKCRTRRKWDSVVPRVIYCRSCGRTWELSDRDIQNILTREMLDSLVTVDDRLKKVVKKMKRTAV